MFLTIGFLSRSSLIRNDASYEQVRNLKQVKLGGNTVDVKVENTRCNICLENTATALFHANHRVCANCMASWVRTQVFNGKSNIGCPGSCNVKIPMSAAFTVWLCGLSDQEWKDWEFWLNKNALGFKICPNAQCKRFIMRDQKGMRVMCPSCENGEFCWLCLKQWRGNGNQQCANVNCTATSEALGAAAGFLGEADSAW